MKVLFKLMIMAFLVAAINPLMAMEDNSLETLVSVKNLEQGKVQLTYLGKSPEKVHVQIYDEKNKKVFKETINSQKGIKKPYNISSLPYGEYVFEVRVADEITKHKVSHEAPAYPGNVILQAASFDEGKFKMMVMGPEFIDVKVRIYNENNELLYQHNIRQQNNWGKVFNLEDTNVQSVKLVLSNKTQILQRKTINL